MADKLTSKLADLPPLLIGVSGGADSVALLHALVEAGHRPHVCHLNHQWRGAASDADAAFVRELAGTLGLPVTIESCTVDRTEAAARQARLDFFAAVAQRTGIHAVALAHTADDQAETMLMRFIQGAGLDGLAGIWPDRDMAGLRIIRPWLTVTRAEVLEYLKANRFAYREDASNADSRFLRNRIRHELLPLLEREYNPAIRAALCRTAEIIRAELAGEPVAAERRAVRRLSFQQVEELRRATRRKPVTRLAGEWPVNLAGLTEIPELGLHLETASAGGERFDAGKLGPAPTIRTWRDGDRFQPLGMTGEKKLQDFFVDKKIPRPQRHRVPLLCATDGRIAWVVGYRIAEPFKVTPGTSKVICFTARVTTT